MELLVNIKTKAKCVNRLIILIVNVYAAPLFADNGFNRENQIKAVYLTHFAELTRWPEQFNLHSSFTICLHGQSIIAPFLEELSDELINNKALKILLLNDLNKQHNCRIIYFDDAAFSAPEKKLSELFPETLLVGNSRQFAINHGSIAFQLEGNKIKIIINLSQIRRTGLDISSKLLRIADVIE